MKKKKQMSTLLALRERAKVIKIEIEFLNIYVKHVKL